MTPPTRSRFMTVDHSTEAPEKSYVSAGASPPPYGMNELFSVQQTDWKIAAGRRGHDPALRYIPSNTNLSACCPKPICTFYYTTVFPGFLPRYQKTSPQGFVSRLPSAVPVHWILPSRDQVWLRMEYFSSNSQDLCSTVARQRKTVASTPT